MCLKQKSVLKLYDLFLYVVKRLLTDFSEIAFFCRLETYPKHVLDVFNFFQLQIKNLTLRGSLVLATYDTVVRDKAGTV